MSATYDPVLHAPLTVSVPSNGTTLTTNLSYDTSVFPLGRLSSTQTSSAANSKQPSSVSYYPNGLVQSVTSPAPGSTAGNPSTVTTSYSYTALGNLSSVIVPAPNFSGMPVSYTYNYTDDSGFTPAPYTQAEVLGEPLSVTVSTSV